MEIELPVITINQNGKQMELDLGELIPIDEAALSSEFSNQPSLFAYIGVMCARAESAWLDSKRILENVKAEVEIDVRADHAGEKVTEAGIKAMVLLTRRVQEAMASELLAREQYLTLRAVTDAMEQRAQMLISLGAHQRAEMEQVGMTLKDRLDSIHSHGHQRGANVAKVARAALSKSSNFERDDDDDDDDRPPF